MKLALVGIYPTGTLELLKKLLGEGDYEIVIADTEEKKEKLEGIEIIILRMFTLDKECISKNKNLKLILKWGAGFDTIDIKAAGERNITVANCPGANAYAVSEIAIMLMLSVYRNLIVQNQAMVKGIWTKTKYLDRSYGILGKTVGLIGCGNVAKQVAKKVQSFDASTQYYDINRMSLEDEERLKIKYVELDELLKTSDIISMHLPLNKYTKNYIDKEKISLMKDTAVIINTSRGGIINEKDLIEALKDNRILGAGLDCIENEPVQEGDPILSAPNVTLTPHIGGTAADLLVHMVPMLAENIMRYKSGLKVKHIVNEEYLNN